MVLLIYHLIINQEKKMPEIWGRLLADKRINSTDIGKKRKKIDFADFNLDDLDVENITEITEPDSIAPFGTNDRRIQNQKIKMTHNS
jgi:hypothetical protein